MTNVEKYLQDFFTEDEVAKILGIEVTTLRNRIYAGKDHPPYIPGKEKLFPKDAFDKWNKSRLKKEINRAS